MTRAWILGISLALVGVVGTSWAQTASIALSGASHDGASAVEVTADKLSIDQASSAASFAGNALVSQGELRLGADNIRVEYLAEGGVAKVEATGNVTLSPSRRAARRAASLQTFSRSAPLIPGVPRAINERATSSARGNFLACTLRMPSLPFKSGGSTTI